MEQTIQQITEVLLHQRNVVNEMTEVLQREKAKRDEMQMTVMNKLKELEFNSVKIGSTTVSRSTKRTMLIVDESELIKDLKSKGLNDCFKEQIDKTIWKGLSSQLTKNNEVYPGTQINETEYISIRNNKPKK